MRSRYSRPLGLAIARLIAEGHSLGDIAGKIPAHQPGLSRWKRAHPELAVLHSLGALLELLNKVGDEKLDARWRRIREELERALYAPPRHQPEFLDPVLEELEGLFGPEALAAAVRNGPGRELVLAALAERDGGAAE